MKYYQIKLMKYYKMILDKSLIHNKPAPDIFISIAKKTLVILWDKDMELYSTTEFTQLD